MKYTEIIEICEVGLLPEVLRERVLAALAQQESTESTGEKAHRAVTGHTDSA